MALRIGNQVSRLITYNLSISTKYTNQYNMTKQNGVYLLIGNELKKVKEYNNEADARVAVVHEGTVVVVSLKTLGEAEYVEAVRIAIENGAKLGSKVDWVIVDSQLDETNEALRLLGQDVISGEYWTDNAYTRFSTWCYNSYGSFWYGNNLNCYVRPLSSFPLDTLK